MLPLFAAQAIVIATAVTGAATMPAPAVRMPAVRAVTGSPATATANVHKIYGVVESVSGQTLVLKDRTGRTVVVDGHLAFANVRLNRGRPIIVYGTTDAGGTVHATAVWRTFSDTKHWPADR